MSIKQTEFGPSFDKSQETPSSAQRPDDLTALLDALSSQTPRDLDQQAAASARALLDRQPELQAKRDVAIGGRTVEKNPQAQTYRNRRRIATAVGAAVGLATVFAGAEAVEQYQASQEHHVVFEDITPGLVSGETPTHAIAASVQSYIESQGINQGAFPSEDVRVAADEAAGQWKDLAGLDYVDTGAQFKVTVLQDATGDLDVEAEAVDPN